MSNLDELLKQRKELDDQIKQVQQAERSEAIRTIRELVVKYDLDLVKDLGNVRKSTSSSAKGSTVAIKYRNNETGDTWTGRGLQPKWVQAAVAAGKKLEDFAV